MRIKNKMGIVESKINSLIFYPPNINDHIENLKERGKVFKLSTISNTNIYMR